MKSYINHPVQNGVLPSGLLAKLILQKRNSASPSVQAKRKVAEYLASNANTPPMPDTGSLGSTNENDLPSPPDDQKNTVDTTGNPKNVAETSNTVDTTGNPK